MPWGKTFLLFVLLLVVAVAIYRFTTHGSAGMTDISQNNINSALLVFGTLGAGYVMYKIGKKYV
jgi:hypothetical protein